MFRYRAARFAANRCVALALALPALGACVPRFTTAPGADGGGANPIGPLRATFTPSGAIVATSGQTITGLHITSTTGPCITLRDVSDVRIYDNEIGPCGAVSESGSVGVDAERSHSVTVEHNFIHDVASAFRASAYTGANARIVFDHNRVTDVFGPAPRGQMVQIVDVRGAGTRVTCNLHDQRRLTGYETDEHIGILLSEGTAADPIEVAYNRVRGSSGASTSGCGISLCAGGACGYLNVHDNTVVNPGGCGFGVAAGHDIVVSNTRVFIGMGEATAEVGAYIWNQSMDVCAGNTLRGNRVFAFRRDGSRNDFYNAENCTGTTLDGNVIGDTTLTPAIFDERYPACD